MISLAGIQRRRTLGAGVPEIVQTLQQKAEGVLGIGLADRQETLVPASGCLVVDIGQRAVVGEDVAPAGELPVEGMGVLQMGPAARGHAHVSDHAVAGQLALGNEAHPGARGWPAPAP